MRRDRRGWLDSWASSRAIKYAVLLVDLAVTAAVWFALPSHGVGTGRIITGVFILFPVVLMLAIGIPIAVVGAIKDARRVE